MPALILVAWRFFAAIFRAFRNPEFQALGVSVATILAGGIWFYMRVEGWGFIDALYFCVITLTTVGYGDFSPATAVGKVFTVFYILLGLGLIAAFITVIAHEVTNNAREVAERRQKRRQSNA